MMAHTSIRDSSAAPGDETHGHHYPVLPELPDGLRKWNGKAKEKDKR